MPQVVCGNSSASTVPAALIDRPLVSIIIITYNDLQYVGEAIDSALAQAYPNCEVIVVDDGSTDGTGQFIADHYGGRVRYHWKENGGQGSARSQGLQMASGMYIQNLDSDDILLSHKIETHVTYLEEHPELAFVYGKTLCFYDDRSQTWEQSANTRARSGNLLGDIMLNRNPVNVAAPLIRRSWMDGIGGWDSDIREADDFDIIARLFYAGAVCHFLDGEPVFLYRHRRNLSSPNEPVRRHSVEGQLRGEIHVLDKLRVAMVRDSRPELAFIEHSLGDQQFELGRWLFTVADRRKDAILSMIQGLKLNRERLLYKLGFLFAAFCLPGPPLVRLKRRLRAVFLAGKLQAKVDGKG